MLSVVHGIVSLPVVTESGERVGHVEDLRFEEGTARVSELVVLPFGVASRLIKNRLVVPYVDIVRFEAKRVVIKDLYARKRVPLLTPVPTDV